MIDFTKISLPFNANDLLHSSFGFLNIVGPFILLGLTLLFFSIFKYLFEIAISTHKDNKLNEGRPRDQYSFFGAVKADIWEDKLYDVRKRFRR